MPEKTTEEKKEAASKETEKTEKKKETASKEPEKTEKKKQSIQDRMEQWMQTLNRSARRSRNPLKQLASAAAGLVLATGLLAWNVLGLAAAIVALPLRAAQWGVQALRKGVNKLRNPGAASEQQAEKQEEKQAEKQVEKQAEKQAEKQTEKQVEKQAEKQTEKQVEKQAEKQAEKQVEQQAEKQTEKQVEQQAEPQAAPQKPTFKRNYDAINTVNAVNAMEIRAAKALGVKEVSQRDLALAVTCLMDSRVAGVGSKYSAFDKCGELLDGLMGKPGASIDPELLKKGLKAAQVKAPLEREMMLNNIRNLSRMVNRAPSLSNPRAMAAGKLLETVLDECDKATDVMLQGLHKKAEIDKLRMPSGGPIKEYFQKDLRQIRGTAAMSKAYRMGMRAQADEQWKSSDPEHVMSQDNAQKIAAAELLDRIQVNSVIEAKQKMFLDTHKGQKLPDIGKLRSPDPFSDKYMNEHMDGMVESMGSLDLEKIVLDVVVPKMQTTERLTNRPAREVLAELNQPGRPIANAIEKEFQELMFPEKNQAEKQAEKSMERKAPKKEAPKKEAPKKEELKKEAPKNAGRHL